VTFENLTIGLQYRFQVIAKNAVGETPYCKDGSNIEKVWMGKLNNPFRPLRTSTLPLLYRQRRGRTQENRIHDEFQPGEIHGMCKKLTDVGYVQVRPVPSNVYATVGQYDDGKRQNCTVPGRDEER